MASPLRATAAGGRHRAAPVRSISDRGRWVRLGVAAGLTALLVPVAGLVVPLISSDPTVMAQASATPKPGSAGGNHSKPGDNKKKKKKSDNKKKSNNSNRGGSSARGSRSDSGTQRSGSSFSEQTNVNNRWSADGPNRSVNTRISSQAQPPRPAQAPSQVINANPSQGQQNSPQSTPAQDTATTPTQVATPPVAQQNPRVVLPAQGDYAPGEQTTTTVTPAAPNDPTGPATALVVGLAAAGAGAASRRNGSTTPTSTTSSDPSQGVRGGFSVTHIGQTDGDQTLVTLTDPSSPTRYDFDASQLTPDGGSLRVNPDQTVSVLNASGTATGDGFSAPWARDATGAAQPTQFTAQGTTLTQTITPRPDAVYPITADPNGIGGVGGVALAPLDFKQGPLSPLPESPWEYNNGYTTTVKAVSPDGSIVDGGSLVSLNDVWNELHRSFNSNFPIGGAPSAFPRVGDKLPLEMKFGDVKAANLPVEVTEINRAADAIDIEFATLPGHEDGPGSTIHFRWTEQAGAPHLDIRGYITEGPGSENSLFAAPERVGYTALAKVVWQPYIDNVVTHVVQTKGYEALPLTVIGGR